MEGKFPQCAHLRNLMFPDNCSELQSDCEVRDMKTIAFDEDYFEKGLKTIVTCGTVVWTAQPHVYHVPDDTVKILRQKGIPFQVVDANGKSAKS